MVTADDIQQPMDETKDYFDATASVLAMGEKLKVLESFITLQLEINQKILARLKALSPEAAASIHMPKLIGLGKPN